MAGNERRRQKKLESKRIKRKEQSREIARVQSSGLAATMKPASHWPVVQARVTATLWDEGIGYAQLVRKGPNGLTAMAVFLLDVHCLGIKDVMARVGPDYALADTLGNLNKFDGGWNEVSPEYVRALVEQSMGYALSLGLRPHSESDAAMLIFGDLDASKCQNQFEFGIDGLPHYCAGPHDSETRILKIMKTLHETCGEGRYNYTLPIASNELTDELEAIFASTETRSIAKVNPEAPANL